MVGVNGPKYTPPSGSLYSKGMKFQGAGGNIVNSNKTLGTTGMTKAEFKSAGEAGYLARKEAFDSNKSSEYAGQLQKMGQMYGVNIDPMMADTNGNGFISKKEFNNMEKLIQQYAMQNMYQNQNGQTSQGGNAFGLLNSLTDTAGNVMGMINGNSGDASGSNSGGGFIDQAAGWVKGLFG